MTVIVRPHRGNRYFGVTSQDRRAFPGAPSIAPPPRLATPCYPKRWWPQKAEFQPFFNALFSYHLSLNVRHKADILHVFSIAQGPNIHSGNFGGKHPSGEMVSILNFIFMSRNFFF